LMNQLLIYTGNFHIDGHYWERKSWGQNKFYNSTITDEDTLPELIGRV